jgi:hypothetical protein
MNNISCAISVKILHCALRISGYLALVDWQWQQVVSLVIVGIAASSLLWARFHRRKFSFARDTHCGCSGHSSRSQNSIVFHARRGEPSRIVVKMK